MSEVSSHMLPLLDGCKKNRQNWETLSTEKNKQLEDERENEKENEEEDDSEDKAEAAPS